MNKIDRSPNPNRKLRQASAGVVLGTLGLLGVLKGLDALDNQAKSHFDKIEQTALEQTKTGWNAVVVLHEGAIYRTAPITANTDGDSGPGTVAGKVGKGEVLRIDRPITYVEAGPSDQAGDTAWFGFTLPSKKGETPDGAELRNVYWVNATALTKQSTPRRSLVDVYNYRAEGRAVDDNNLNANTGEELYSLTIDDDKNFKGDMGRKGGPVATASAMPTAIFDQMVQNEGLLLSHGK